MGSKFVHQYFEHPLKYMKYISAIGPCTNQAIATYAVNITAVATIMFLKYHFSTCLIAMVGVRVSYLIK